MYIRRLFPRLFVIAICRFTSFQFAGILGNSSALVADAAHSVSDMLCDYATLLTIRYSSAPADVGHPYGHGRIEDVGTMCVAGIVFFTGIGIGAHAIQDVVDILILTQTTPIPSTIPTSPSSPSSSLLPGSLSSTIDTTIPSLSQPIPVSSLSSLTPLSSSSTAFDSTLPPSSSSINSTSPPTSWWHQLLQSLSSILHSHDHPGYKTPSSLTLAVALFSVAIKEWLFHRTLRVAKKQQSRILDAAAWHHRSDAGSSAVAVVGKDMTEYPQHMCRSLLYSYCLYICLFYTTLPPHPHPISSLSLTPTFRTLSLFLSLSRY